MVLMHAMKPSVHAIASEMRLTVANHNKPLQFVLQSCRKYCFIHKARKNIEVLEQLYIKQAELVKIEYSS